jgi:hypothetical protein
MDPITLYLLLFAGALVVCLVASAVWRPPSRPCPECGQETPIQARRCRHCGYAPAGA